MSKTLLFDGILRYDEFVVVEACLVSGGRYLIIILDHFVCRSLVRACFYLLLCWIVLEGVVFGTFWGVIISCAGISILAVAGFRAAPLTSALGLFL